MNPFPVVGGFGVKSADAADDRRARGLLAGFNPSARFIIFHGIALWICFTALRITLAVRFAAHAPIGVADYFRCFVVGAWRDVGIAVLFSLPWLFWMFVLSKRWHAAKWQRGLFSLVYISSWMGFLFLLVTEYFFFEEFKSRFNTVAIDYLIYPQEVFTNLWEAYPITKVLSLCLVAAIGVGFSFRTLRSRIWVEPHRRGAAFRQFCLALLFFVVAIISLRFASAHFSRERLINELANNGVISVVVAAWSHNLDYGAFYPVIDRDEAFARARKILAAPGEVFTGPPDSLTRRVPGDPGRPRLNIVLLLEESLGSEFWGSLGRKKTLTPELDKLSQEGMFFVNMYATGNRTVRGFEGVLSSFPPLPGDSIVKRDHSENVETIARVLRRDGYRTTFVYGGRGLFDGMGSFTLRNGYERFIEQKDFLKPTFTTAWGVCNEDLYRKTIEECRELDRKGEPFLMTTLSVSNHKPYTYPPGRISEDPKKHKRDYAVKYTDWSLGQFFAAAKKERFWTNTIFVVVADHGARVYGSQSIPIHSYEVPLLILGPAAVQTPSRHEQLGSQLDVAPTILGLLGRPYETTFFGHDLLKMPVEQHRILVNHNRDIGIAVGEHLVVMSMNKKLEYYPGNPKTDALLPVDSPDEIDKKLELDAVALFQTADDLYMKRNYRVNDIR